MTLIEGERGVIVVDTLTSIEGARAAMELYFEHRGRAAGERRHFHPHPYRSLGRRARRARRRNAGERPGADHRAQSVHGACGFREHHRRPRDAAASAISVRAVPGEGSARPGRLRARQVDGGGLGGAVAADRPHHGDRRQAHHRRARVRIPDGAEQRSAGGNALLRCRVTSC